MPRSRETAISWAARRAAKYRFQGTVTSTTSQDRATTSTAMVSSVDVGMRTTRAAQATSSARSAAASRTNHQAMTRVEEFLLMLDSMSAGHGASHPLEYSYSLGTDTGGFVTGLGQWRAPRRS